MAEGVTLGFMKFVLSLDTDGFAGGAGKAQNLLGDLRDALVKLDRAVADAGRGLTKGVTLPVVGMGAAVVKVAGDFEAAMGKVAISTGATGERFDELRKLAIGIGQDTVFGAEEAAGAIDDLAKTGLSAEQILGGAAKATAALAAAAGSELSPAATAVSDVMAQFRLETDKLPAAVNIITGAVNQSKLSFEDYQLAIAQAGGVAAGLGVSFEDFNTALAATSPLFASGSDAGTSFKTFLTRLVPSSKAAAAAMQEYGLSFFDAAGNMRPIGEIAEQLRVKLGGLSDRDLNDVMSTIFGQDAMRTGIALMREGSAGLDEMRGRILATDAAAQAAQRMGGFNAQIEQLKGAFEALAIAIADTGLLTMVTALVGKVTNFVTWLATANPVVMKIVAGFVAFAAALGPIMVVISALATVLLPLLIARMSPLGLLFTAIVNPVGTVVSLLARAVVQFGGLGAAVRLVAPMLLRFLGPIGLIVSAIQMFGPKVFPVLQELWERAKAVLGPELGRMFAAAAQIFADIGTALAGLASGPVGMSVKLLIDFIGELLGALLGLGGNAVIAQLKFMVQILTASFQAIGGVVRVIIKLLSGDFSGAWNEAKATVSTVARTVLAAFNALAPGAIAAIARMVTGIRDWVVGKLGAIWGSVKSNIDTVAGWFRWLDDVVVRHSYIPDMVDSIGDEMARLDQVMVKPAERATRAVADRYRELAEEVGPLLDRLFPEERAQLQLGADLLKVEKARKGGAISEETAEEARRRLYGIKGPAITEPTFPPVVLDDSWTKLPDEVGGLLEQTADRSRVAWVDMARSATDGVRNIVDAIRGGSILDVLSSLLDVFGQLGGMGVFGKKIQTNLGNTPGFGGFRAAGGPVVPGKSYVVGEDGPEWFTPRARGFVTPNGSGSAGGRTLNFDLRGAVVTADLLDQMNQMAFASAGQVVTANNATLMKRGRQRMGR